VSAVWLVGARLVDGTGREPLERQDIRIEEGRIAALGRAPAGADAIELHGFTVTPGLIDAHVHLGLSAGFNDLFTHQLSVAEIAADIFNNAAQTLDAGYTTVRDTGGIDRGVAHTIAWGKVRGPRVIQCGPLLAQRGGHGAPSAPWEPAELWGTHHIPGLCALSLLSDGADQVRTNAREAFRRGADFIKMCVSGGVVSLHDNISDTQFTIEEIAAAVHEASARGTYVTVHSHNVAGIRNAVTAGVKCVEHGSGIDESTAQLMKNNDVALVPTFTVIDQLIANSATAGLTEGVMQRANLVRQAQIDGFRQARAAGVTVGLGSDLVGSDQTARAEELSFRSELETPMDALVAATQTNAQILRVAHETGTAEVGKLADLVAWRNNPLENPSLFADRRQVAMVLKAGRPVKDIRLGQS
jgi:imidazolonepropionase-like amidohydrolase